MKKVLILFIPVCMLACNSSSTSDNASAKTDSSTTMATKESEPVSYAYPVSYSSDFELGDSKHAQTVLKIWKDYDNNTFDNDAGYFADSVRMEFAEGNSFSGSKDSLISALKSHRGMYSSAVSTVDVVTALKPKGKDEQWVCVWGKEVDEMKGKKDSVYLNEDWRFNKDGKVDFVTQYMQKAPSK